MAKKVITLLLILSFSALFYQCIKDKNIIKIGLVAGLTGRLSEIGIETRNGAHLAVKNINALGGINGKKIELIVKNHKYDADICKQVIGELHKEGVTLIVGPQLSKMAQPVLDATKDKNMLIISPVVSTDEIKDLDDNFIRLMPVAFNQGVQLATFAIRDNKTRISVIYDSFNRAYTEAVYRGFKKTFPGKNRKIIYVDPMKKKDLASFSSIAAQVKKNNSDGVILICSSIDTATLAQQLWKKRIKATKYSAAWASITEVIIKGGKAVEGMIFVSTYKGNSNAPKYKAVKEKYEEYYKEKFTFISEYSYEVLLIIKEAVSQTKSVNPDEVKKYILTKSKFKGLRDSIEFNKYGDPKRKLSYTIIKDGKFVLYK